jgi:hypothetical protein
MSFLSITTAKIGIIFNTHKGKPNMHAFELFPGSRIGIGQHSHKNHKCLKINNIAISVIERKKRLK